MHDRALAATPTPVAVPYPVACAPSDGAPHGCSAAHACSAVALVSSPGSVAAAAAVPVPYPCSGAHALLDGGTSPPHAPAASFPTPADGLHRAPRVPRRRPPTPHHLTPCCHLVRYGRLRRRLGGQCDIHYFVPPGESRGFLHCSSSMASSPGEVCTRQPRPRRAAPQWPRPR